MRILIVEDEKRMAHDHSETFEDVEFAFGIAVDSEAGLDCALSDIYDLIILPKMDGLAVLSALRKQGVQTPVMILTVRGNLPERMQGLDAGADYYLAKPFVAGEFLACVRALLLRTGEVFRDKIQYKDLTLWLETGMLSCGDESIQLSRKELELRRLLMANGGTPVDWETMTVKVGLRGHTREQRFWGLYEFFAEKAALSAFSVGYHQSAADWILPRGEKLLIR